MKFLYGSKLSSEIKKVMEQPDARCAVAFWGKGAEKWIKADARVICNLASGGTNPFAIEKLDPNIHIRQVNDLHAKVYIGKTIAIVTSANASANGLGLEGSEQAGWQEAGIATNDITSISEWFEGLWKAAKKIDGKDLDAAKEAWRLRQKIKPTTSFGTVDFSSTDLPLINWVGDAGWEPNKDTLIAALGRYDDKVWQQIDEGVEIEGPEDRDVFQEGRWVLTWHRDKEGLPTMSNHRKPWFAYVDKIVDGAYTYTGETTARDVVLASDQKLPMPFNVGERRFRKSFRDIMSRKGYQNLRTGDYQGAWFTPKRVELMRKLWRDVQKHYLASK